MQSSEHVYIVIEIVKTVQCTFRRLTPKMQYVTQIHVHIHTVHEYMCTMYKIMHMYVPNTAYLSAYYGLLASYQTKPT